MGPARLRQTIEAHEVANDEYLGVSRNCVVRFDLHSAFIHLATEGPDRRRVW